MKNFGEQFLHQKDSKLHTTKVVEIEKDRRERKGENVSQKPADKISDWLEVIEKTHLGHQDDNRILDRIKDSYHREYVIKEEDVPESTFLLEQKIAREQGHGAIEITDQFRQEKSKQIINGQEQSLDKWLDYLSSPDATYPTWAKYWAFKSMLTMGKFEKQEDKETREEKVQFKKRTKNTVASFPPLNPRALAMTISAIIAKAEDNSKNKNEREDIQNFSKKLNEVQFKELLSTENFSKIYAQFLMEMPEYSNEGLKETRGVWKTYLQGSEPDELVKSLEGHPLEWCTANIDTARTQLQGGNFHVYYSINENGEAVIPRVAIRMQGDSIAEVRGIAANQNMDPYIGDIVKEKMADFPDGEEYKKKAADMKRLTEIEEKNNRKEKLTKEDLVFLYEIDSPIEGFGYDRDPRIQEIILNRDLHENISIFSGCQQEEIAYFPQDFNEKTKVYIGPPVSGVFSKKIEHVYISFSGVLEFPECLKNEIKQFETNIGKKSKEELIRELKERANSNDPIKKIRIDYAEYTIENPEFVVAEKQVEIKLVQLGIRDLFHYDFVDFNYETIDVIYKKAKELGLELCPAEVSLYLILENEKVFKEKRNAYEAESYLIAMNPIESRIFNIGKDSHEPELSTCRVPKKISVDRKFIFCYKN